MSASVTDTPWEPLDATLETDQDVTLPLLEESGVAAIQGSAYGQSPFFRISFATDLTTITLAIAAIAAIAAAVGELR